ELEDYSDIGHRNMERKLEKGLLNPSDRTRFGKLGRVLNFDHGVVVAHHAVHDAWCGGYEIQSVLALQTLLHDVHVEQAQKPAAETKTKRFRGVRLEHERAIVQVKLLERFSQLAIGVTVRWKDARKDHGLDFLKPREWFPRLRARIGHCIANLDVVNRFDARG